MIFPHSTQRNVARAPQSRARPLLTTFFPINHSLNILRCDSTISSSPTPPCFRGPRSPFLSQDNTPKKLKNIWPQKIRTGGPAVHGITNLIPSTWHSCTRGNFNTKTNNFVIHGVCNVNFSFVYLRWIPTRNFMSFGTGWENFNPRLISMR
jgi:hypothetical protein